MNAPTRGATRQQRYRQRQRAGTVPLIVDVDEVALTELLIAAGYLAVADRECREAMRNATERWLADVCAPQNFESVTLSLRAALQSAIFEP